MDARNQGTIGCDDFTHVTFVFKNDNTIGVYIWKPFDQSENKPVMKTAGHSRKVQCQGFCPCSGELEEGWVSSFRTSDKGWQEKEKLPAGWRKEKCPCKIIR